MRSRKLENKIVVVTGASSGVGRAIARRFGAEGAKVALIARDLIGLEDAASEIRIMGGQAMVLPLDVSDAAAVERAADRVASLWGRIDVWVNDAMVSVFAPVNQTTPDEYRRVIEVNYLGYVHGTLAALKHMRAVQRRGDRADRLGRRLSVDPAPERLQRVEGGRPRVHGRPPQRAHPGGERNPGDPSSAAGRQHAAVRGGAQQAAFAPAPGPAHLPARGHRRGRVARSAASAPRDLDRMEHHQGDRRTAARSALSGSLSRAQGVGVAGDPPPAAGAPAQAWRQSVRAPAGGARGARAVRCGGAPGRRCAWRGDPRPLSRAPPARWPSPYPVCSSGRSSDAVPSTRRRRWLGDCSERRWPARQDGRAALGTLMRWIYGPLIGVAYGATVGRAIRRRWPARRLWPRWAGAGRRGLSLRVALPAAGGRHAPASSAGRPATSCSWPAIRGSSVWPPT